MTADYSMGVDAVPVLATKEIINGTQNLDVLGSLHRAVSFPSAWPDLPSWVPHYIKPLGPEVMVYYNSLSYFNAAGGRSYRFFSSMSSNSSHLVISGRKFDEVQHTFELEDVPNPNSDRCGWDAHKFWIWPAWKLRLKVCGQLRWLPSQEPVFSSYC